MDKIQLVDKLKVIEPDRGYWFVRTDSGVNYDTFVKYGFIGIGWNQITLEDLVKLSPKEAQEKIAKTQNYNLELTRGKSKATAIYNKLIRFRDIKKGDVVIIPSFHSSRLAFGIVEDSNVFIDTEKSHECEYYKRKKVSWVLQKNIDSLDQVFYEVKITRHAISNVKQYEDFIDRVTSTFYYKDNFGNFVFEINKDEDINLIQLVDLISSIQTVITEINKFYGYGENVEENVIKLSLQSKGKFTLKSPIGRSLATFGLVFSLFDCQNKQQQPPNSLNSTELKKAEQFVSANADSLKNIENRMNQLDLNKDKINSVFK
jgi:restriction system protein